MYVNKSVPRKSLTLKEFAALTGVPYNRFKYRLSNMGMSVMQAVTADPKELRSKGATKHGYKGTPTYATWQSMIERCEKRELYLRLGITVCERWRNDFSAFLSDMGERPTGTTIDRINGKLGYYKENCRWATPREQAQNTSCNINLTAFGKTQCVAEWARELGLNEFVVYQRLERGYPPERALSKARIEWFHRKIRPKS
jgi:hypothetical protein